MTTSTVRTRYSPAVLEGIAAGERAVLRLVLVRGDAGAVREAAAAALARGEELADVAREREPPLSPIACKPGCSACCSAMVLASPAEVLRIADHLRRTLAPDGIATLLRKVHTAHARSAGLTRAERLDAKVPCPLLDDTGACSVHTVRPLVCAGWNSLDAAGCDAHFVARTAPVPPPLHAQSHELCHAVLGGLVGASLDAGLDGRPVELHAALAIALTDETAGERWLRGEPVFAPSAPAQPLL